MKHVPTSVCKFVTVCGQGIFAKDVSVPYVCVALGKFARDVAVPYVCIACGIFAREM